MAHGQQADMTATYAEGPRAVYQMHSFWHALSMLGDSRLLLPSAAVLISGGIWQGHQWARRWALGLAAVSLMVLASKLAFLGWGLGVARWDFTGFSGHAAMSAAIWPLAIYVAIPKQAAGRWYALVGLLLAAAIAYSRLPLNAHSASEVVSGWALGTLASVWVASAPRAGPRFSTLWFASALTIGICIPVAAPKIHTHVMIVQLAKSLSGATKEFDRSSLHLPPRA